MLSPLLNQSMQPLLEQTARFAELRQQVLAGNIANIDTPGYKTRDLPVGRFQEALAQAVTQLQSAGGSSPSPSAPVPLESLFSQELFTADDISSKHLTFQDANNRNVEREVMEMSKNSLLQRFAVEVMTVQMNLLQSVIAGRP